MKKQLLSFVALLCVIWLTPARALAYDFEVDGIYYNITPFSNPRTVEVTNNGYYDGVYAGATIIPETVTYGKKTYTVTSIGQYAFQYCRGLTSIEIPASVTSIGEGAFSGCSSLTSIEIPASVTSIGRYAFGGCSGLTSIVVAAENPNYDSRENCNAIIETSSNTLLHGCNTTVIPNSVTSIGDEAFWACSFTSIEIPSSVTSIGDGGFAFCSRLTSIEIPASVTSIGGGAFNGCSGLTSIKIPDSVTSIDGSAFEGCSGLTSIEIPASVTSIGDYAFNGCSGLTSIAIPNSVTSIGLRAFADCSGFKSIEIPASVTSIGQNAFIGCSGLTSIVVAAGNPNYDSRENCNSIIETSSNTLLQGFKTTVIPNSVTSIGNFAFAYCRGLTSIEIPASVTSIGSDAFARCSGLTSIEIPASVTSIGDYAFENCTGLTSIDIPNSVISIGRMAFYNCSGLTSIEIPSSVTSIGDSGFSGCTGLNKVISHATVPPTCTNDTWSNVNKSTCTLYVPAGTKAAYAYAYATGWSYFTHIEEFDATEITTLDAEASDMNFSDSEIYTMGGQRVDALQAGMNIVRMKNGKVKKIVKR